MGVEVGQLSRLGVELEEVPVVAAGGGTAELREAPGGGIDATVRFNVP